MGVDVIRTGPPEEPNERDEPSIGSTTITTPEPRRSVAMA